MMNDGKVQVATMLDPRTRDRLVRRAKRNRRSIAAELRVAVDAHLAGKPAA